MFFRIKKNVEKEGAIVAPRRGLYSTTGRGTIGFKANRGYVNEEEAIVIPDFLVGAIEECIVEDCLLEEAQIVFPKKFVDVCLNKTNVACKNDICDEGAAIEDSLQRENVHV